MADLIRIKGGSGDVPALQDRELAVKKKGQESELYCGVNGENVRLCGVGDIARIDKLIEDIIARLDALETPSE